MNQAKPMSLMDFVAAARAQVKEVAPAELQTMLETTPDLLLVDVRESSEHEQGHIRNAHLVPRGIIEAAADTQYPKRDEMLSTARERPVVLYCATGGRSAGSSAASGAGRRGSGTPCAGCRPGACRTTCCSSSLACWC